MTRKQKRLLLRIGIAALFFVAGLLTPLLIQGAAQRWVQLAVFLCGYAVVGWDVLWRAVTNILHGQIFDENFLMTIATIGAFALGEYAEGMAVMLFYQVGEWFQSYAVGRSRRSIAGLMDIRPDYANVEREGVLVQVDPEQVEVGTYITIRPGERVPIDGIVRRGSSSLDTSALTGEALPREVAPGDEIVSGCINGAGLLVVETTRAFGESTVARILELVESSVEKKARTENFITRFARWYTPTVVFAALALALLPPLLGFGSFSTWIYRALTFLVISCPCALVISVPLSFFGGIGGASRCGVLVKGSGYLEVLAATDTVVFDKTGTLTCGCFSVTELRPAEGVTQEALLELAACAEACSNHPISQSVRRACDAPVEPGRVTHAEELAGYGVRVRVDGRPVLAGNARLLESEGIAFSPCEEAGTAVYLAVDGRYIGCLLVEDTLKPDAAAAMQALRGAGIRRLVLLTGDADAPGQKVGAALGMDETHTRLLPGDKVAALERILAESEKKVAYVGDGINDAPVLARADVGISMGALGSDAAIEAADVVLMTDEPGRIATVIRIARRTLRIARQNIVFALTVKLLVLLLGALGFASMWIAVFADVGVAVLAILNAIRALRVNNI